MHINISDLLTHTHTHIRDDDCVRVQMMTMGLCLLKVKIHKQTNFTIEQQCVAFICSYLTISGRIIKYDRTVTLNRKSISLSLSLFSLNNERLIIILGVGGRHCYDRHISLLFSYLEKWFIPAKFCEPNRWIARVKMQIISCLWMRFRLVTDWPEPFVIFTARYGRV